jgi:hypothetical protein
VLVNRHEDDVIIGENGVTGVLVLRVKGQEAAAQGYQI